MCFNTTSSNTGRLSGTCIILENLLRLPLLHFGCRHHILELVLAAAFGVCMGPSKAPDVILFKRFQGQWSSIEKEDYTGASSDEFASTEFVNHTKIVTFCQDHLKEQPRNDY